MEDDERAVPGELAVHVHAVHARRERALDGVEAVVGRVVAEAAMAEHERTRGPGDERASIRRLVTAQVQGGDRQREGDGGEDLAPAPATRGRHVNAARCAHSARRIGW